MKNHRLELYANDPNYFSSTYKTSEYVTKKLKELVDQIITFSEPIDEEADVHDQNWEWENINEI